MPVTDKTRFSEIMNEIRELAHEARDLCHDDHPSAYWFPALITALDENHGWLGGPGATMQDSLGSE